MLTRREFLEAGTAIALAPYGCAGDRSAPGVVVNDIHSQLNATRVYRVVKLRAKRRYDPAERFQSDWYRHYKQMFGSPL